MKATKSHNISTVTSSTTPYVVQRKPAADFFTPRKESFFKGTVNDTGQDAETSSSVMIQMKCAECEKEEQEELREEEKKQPAVQRKPIFESNADNEEMLQRSASNTIGNKANTSENDLSIEQNLASSKGRGQQMPAEIRNQMESVFDADFSQVNIHTDKQSGDMNRQLNAKAFAHGRDIYFGEDNYNPDSHQGKHLLTHELTHVVQQTGSDSAHAPVDTPVQRAPDKGTLPALSPEELLKFLLEQRGFGTSKPGLPSIDPKGIGKPTGKGYQTYAVVQLIDKEGKQVKVSLGAYLGGGDLHGETQAIAAMKGSMPKDFKLEGGKMMVAVEQVPCGGCDSAIKSYAKELGVASYEVYVPERPSIRPPGGSVKPKTAATSAFQGGRAPTTPTLFSAESFTAPKGAGVVSAEVQAMAKEAVDSVKTDLKLLRFGKILKAGMTIISGVMDILNAVEYFSMAQSKLSGGAFILNEYVDKSRAINQKSAELAKSYPDISESLTDMQPRLFSALMDIPSAGEMILNMLDFKIGLEQMAEGIDSRKKSIDAAIREAHAKKAFADKILSDPKASGAVAAATFGTGELARLFAISQDLEVVESNLMQASEKFGQVSEALKEDIDFLQGWYNYFLSMCKGDPTCKAALKQGWYTLKVIKATLPDSFLDTPDAYVSNPKSGLKTSVKDDTTTPVWNEMMGKYRFDRLAEDVPFNIYDYDPISGDDLLGSVSANLTPDNPEGQTFQLADGEVTLIVQIEREPEKPEE